MGNRQGHRGDQFVEVVATQMLAAQRRGDRKAMESLRAGCSQSELDSIVDKVAGELGRRLSGETEDHLRGQRS